MDLPGRETPCSNPQGRDRKIDGAVPRGALLRLINLWWHEGRCLAGWSPASRKILSAALRLLQDRLKPVLSPRCTHVKGRGGAKGTVRGLVKHIGDFRFVARFDIASDYDSIQHRLLLDLLDKVSVGESLRALVRQYLEAPDLKGASRGMVAGGALSSLLGALYLLPLDDAMQRLAAKNGIYYLRYVDDMVILSKTRWHLRAAIRELIRVTLFLGLELHREKRFIGRMDDGFDFLGYRIPRPQAAPFRSKFAATRDTCSPALRVGSRQ